MGNFSRCEPEANDADGRTPSCRSDMERCSKGADLPASPAGFFGAGKRSDDDANDAECVECRFQGVAIVRSLLVS